MESGHWRTKDPKTRSIEERLFVLVRDHLSAVSTAALRHRDPNVRQMCAYMLTWSPDPLRAVQTLLEAILDPVGFVRNEAARALIPLGALSVESRGVDVPVEPIVDLLNRPTATDRNKAAAILLQLAADPSKRTTIRKVAEPRLEAMASSRAPLNHDVAVSLLALLRDSR
jgi:HEAT repeat protein